MHTSISLAFAALATLVAAEARLALSSRAAPGPQIHEIRIQALEGLRFDPVRFETRPGEAVRLVLENADVSGMQHNLLITQPDEREAVVQAALALGTRGPALEYVPESDLVLHATELLAQGEGATIEFIAPARPGVYPYVCTFPGHGFVMYGAMYVGVEMPPLEADVNVPESARRAEAAPDRVRAPVERPALFRYPMPDAGPVSIAVALPGEQNYAWDAGAVRLRYLWRGDFVDLSESLHGQSGDTMQLPAEVLGEIWYRAGDEVPLRFGDPERVPAAEFEGYRMVDGLPEFRYRLDGVEVRELIQATPDGVGVVRRFRIGPVAGPVFYVSAPGDGATETASAGKWSGRVLRLAPAEASSFSITLTPRDP